MDLSESTTPKPDTTRTVDSTYAPGRVIVCVYLPGDETVDVEYVPADTHRGAVCVCGNGEAEDDRGAVLRCPIHGPAPFERRTEEALRVAAETRGAVEVTDEMIERAAQTLRRCPWFDSFDELARDVLRAALEVTDDQ